MAKFNKDMMNSFYNKVETMTEVGSTKSQDHILEDIIRLGELGSGTSITAKVSDLLEGCMSKYLAKLGYRFGAAYSLHPQEAVVPIVAACMFTFPLRVSPSGEFLECVNSYYAMSIRGKENGDGKKPPSSIKFHAEGGAPVVTPDAAFIAPLEESGDGSIRFTEQVISRPAYVGKKHRSQAQLELEAAENSDPTRKLAWSFIFSQHQTSNPDEAARDEWDTTRKELGEVLAEYTQKAGIVNGVECEAVCVGYASAVNILPGSKAINYDGKEVLLPDMLGANMVVWVVYVRAKQAQGAKFILDDRRLKGRTITLDDSKRAASSLVERTKEVVKCSDLQL